MPIFCKGAGLGTHWRSTDARRMGFFARAPRNPMSRDRLLQHVGGSTQATPFISLTRSYAIAFDYAQKGGRGFPSEAQPAYVYEVEIVDDGACRVIDPIGEIANGLPAPLATTSFHHDGDQNAMLGIVDNTQARYLTTAVRYPPPQPAKPGVNVGAELTGMVRILRDAEVIAVDHMPARCLVTVP
jgi:hypothetical protein